MNKMISISLDICRVSITVQHCHNINVTYIMACTLNVASLSRLGVSRKYFPQNLYMVRKELYTVKKGEKVSAKENTIEIYCR